jgi:hypothetical protein
MAWISFGPLPCRNKAWWQLASRCYLNRALCLTCFLSADVTRKDLQFSTWTLPSNDTIDSVLRYRKVGRAKDLSALLRTRVLCSAGSTSEVVFIQKRSVEGLSFRVCQEFAEIPFVRQCENLKSKWSGHQWHHTTRLRKSNVGNYFWLFSVKYHGYAWFFWYCLYGGENEPYH